MFASIKIHTCFLYVKTVPIHLSSYLSLYHLAYKIYGSQVWVSDYISLMIRRMSLTTDSMGFQQFKDAFAELNFDIRFENLSRSGIKMSHGLKKSIWWIIKNQGKKWDEIPSIQPIEK